MNNQAGQHDEEPAARSTFALLRRNPRLLAFMVSQGLAAIALGALLVARIEFATQAFGNEVGIGTLAVTFSIAAAVISIPAGMLVDRANPRVILLISMAVIGVSNISLGYLLVRGPVGVALLVGGAVLEGLATGFALPAMLKTQAALVDAHSRGAAEIANLLRLCIGGLIGSLLARLIPDSAAVVLASGALIVIAGCTSFVIASPAVFRPQRGVTLWESVSQVVPRLRADAPLTRAVVADLVMRVVVPTLLLPLFIVDRDINQSAAKVLAAGTIGVLIGSLTLAHFGVSGRMRRPLVVSFVGYLVAIALGGLLLRNDWLIGEGLPQIMLLGFIVAGCAFSAYGTSALTALVQQRSPDDIRGRLAGLLAVPRLVLQALASLIATALITVGNSHYFTVGLAVVTLLALTALLWFKRIDQHDAQALSVGR